MKNILTYCANSITFINVIAFPVLVIVCVYMLTHDKWSYITVILPSELIVCLSTSTIKIIVRYALYSSIFSIRKFQNARRSMNKFTEFFGRE